MKQEIPEAERRLRFRQSLGYLRKVDRRKYDFRHNPDERPNAGLREGDVEHAEVNRVIREAEKTIILGRQNRLHAGVVMHDDEKLPRFHAGHDLVKYFYQALRLIPAYLIDAIFERGITVTMVKDCDLLVWEGPLCHQAFHIGRTRKTIYIPEGLIMSAFERQYSPWSLAEVLLHEAWKLLDYHLILELVRHFQIWMHGHGSIPGFFWVKEKLLELNKHRRIPDEYEQTLRHRFRQDSKRGRRRENR